VKEVIKVVLILLHVVSNDMTLLTFISCRLTLTLKLGQNSTFNNETPTEVCPHNTRKFSLTHTAELQSPPADLLVGLTLLHGL